MQEISKHLVTYLSKYKLCLTACKYFPLYLWNLTTGQEREREIHLLSYMIWTADHIWASRYSVLYESGYRKLLLKNPGHVKVHEGFKVQANKQRSLYPEGLGIKKLFQKKLTKTTLRLWLGKFFRRALLIWRFNLYFTCLYANHCPCKCPVRMLVHGKSIWQTWRRED